MACTSSSRKDDLMNLEMEEDYHGSVTPTKRIQLNSNQCMSKFKAIKNLTEGFQGQNMKISRMSEMFGGEYTNSHKKDIYNHSNNVRHIKLNCRDVQSVRPKELNSRDVQSMRQTELDHLDVQSILTYFKNKHKQDPQFFYAFQCDENSQLSNFFFVDSKSRLAYKNFDDVISFDTTYRTNKYNMSFAPFMGVDHHMQSIQFGCALLGDLSEQTFKWLFETWLAAMGGKLPNAIITDQNLAMKIAIEKVFPKTRHKLFVWEINKQFSEKLPDLYCKKLKFKKDVKRLIWDTYKREDFEEKWIDLMKEYELEDNEWIKKLYEIRELWVLVYIREIFFAGMNTTGKCEGINLFFDDFVTPETNLQEFVLKYEDEVLKRIIKRESDEDYESEHKSRIVKDNDFLLKHAGEIYTRNVFNKFKDEVNATLNYEVCQSQTMVNENGIESFVIVSCFNELEKFIVTLDLNTYKGTCECKKFEFVGILCRHILKVFLRLNIVSLPAHFVLPRWRKKANQFRK